MKNQLLRLSRRAQQVLRSEETLSRLVQELSIKYAGNKLRLKEAARNTALMIQILRNYAAGTYREIPWKSLVIIVAACLYFLNPMDLVADFLPLGFLDDAQVLMFAAAMIKADLKKFQKFIARQQSVASSSNSKS